MATNDLQAGNLKNFWNTRYAAKEYAYGTAPNEFFKLFIDGATPGKILIAGAGEGRDAVYAAEKGWEVYCVDLSDEGKNKALKLAEEKGVNITYYINDITSTDFPENSFDCVASIFCHLPVVQRQAFHLKATGWIKQGGYFVLEAFTPEQLKYTSGGPKDKDVLVSENMLATEFEPLEIVILRDTEKMLHEGSYHEGKVSVVEFLGKKK